MEEAQALVKISGRVQGVYFRAYTRDMALSLELKGYVRNLRNGDVEAVFVAQGKGGRGHLLVPPGFPFGLGGQGKG